MVTDGSAFMKKAATSFLVALLILLMLPLSVFASRNESQHINYITNIFNEENGLPTEEANAIVQAQNGYMWIGSYGGLLRYDGSTFVDFSDRLESSAVRALYESSDGTLYIGTNDAGAYRFRDDVFTQLRTENENIFLCIRDFAEGKDGAIYIASPSGAAKLSGDIFIPYEFDEMKDTQIINVAVDGAENVWAMSDAGELYVFNDDGFLNKVVSGELFDEAAIYTVSSDHEGSIYVGSTDRQIVKLSIVDGSVPTRIDSYERTYYDTDPIGSINKIKAVYDGTVLVSALKGFGYIDSGGVFRRVDKDADNNLSANWAELDQEGNYWIASSNYGIIHYCVGCFDSCNYNSNLGKYTVNAVAKAGNVFYVGTDSGVMLFDDDWNQIESKLTETLRGCRVRSITVDSAGRVWLATYSSHGALCYDPAAETITDFGEAQGLSSEKVRVVYELSDGRMLIGNQLGINIIENGIITESYSGADGMGTTSVLCAMELDGRIYVGTDGSGIYEITKNGLVNMSFDEGLSHGVVLRMEPDADGNGNYYVCAGDKLFYCENDRFRLLSGIDKGSGSIYSVYDMDGRIWLLQNAGIFSADKKKVLNGENVYTVHYGVDCGITGTLNANTWNWIDEEGGLYIPTRSGISLFYFKGPYVAMPRVVLNGITVDDTFYEHPASLKIASSARRVTIDISELLFTHTSEFMIGYQLEGFDTSESFTTDKHISISYTNLKGGHYSLKIRIIDPLTGESSAEQEFSIIKQKKITEYVWFCVFLILLGAFIVAVLVWLVIRKRTKALIKKQDEQLRYINDITKVFSECVDMRDAYTKGHSGRVAKYTALLAKKLGKTQEEVERMHGIALLHDVGKISIPDAVLNKPGRLTDEEFAIMKSHAQRGYDVLNEIAIDHDLALGAGCHHERYDGTGYPAGLKGDEIPEVAQIIAVADAFDAMYSTRPYRKKMELSAVVEEIKRVRGTQLSPRVVDAFLQLYEEGAFDDE